MLTPLELLSVLLLLTAVFSWLNERYVGLPETVGVLIMGLVSSILLLLAEIAFQNVSLYEEVTGIVRQIDFQHSVLDGMLAFLLFAGALHVDFSALRRRAVVVAAMATVGVAISTLVIAISFWYLGGLLGTPVSFVWALVFGALISPTDPVAVLATLKSVQVPISLEADMSGESLFNDGVGVVLFTVMLTLAVGDGHSAAGFSGAANLLALEALGGAALGLAGGYLAYAAMRQVDNYSVEVLISIALVTALYAFATRVGTSGPIAVVVAGLFVGNRGPHRAMSDLTQRYLFGFWTLVDEILNAILFLLIGLEVLVLRLDPSLGWLPLAAIPIVLLARFAAVGVPFLALSRWTPFVKGTVATLTWGGLRGGISVALALSIPEIAEKSLILAATYVVVIFTIIIQGLTLKRLVKAVVQ
ncbi:sodium:proton antiporter [Rhizobium sp. SSA_523]|uniref:cation:proton antiporter n=1 Tax=Rhizobium sp. SSA_523 TaxID=2952477 RepID=UPI0020906728|nr:sodium:proton antiporter [Rhizobium sp. SSA_523]MCO5733409.1 sodium:proton antiporter [Rhizobium sp. SSA_523]WKC21618.1 sodium:proton antiporter [Rhizobium sp. SSA_523]